MSKIAPCLWFLDQAEAAATFYVSLLPESRIDRVQKNVIDSPAGKAGSVLVVYFTLAGQQMIALNGGSPAQYSNAMSLSIDCIDQAEIDRLWAALGDGGTEQQCGWLNDRWGVPWQIVPHALPEMLGDPDAGRAGRVMAAMMGMVKLDIAGLQRAYDAAV